MIHTKGRGRFGNQFFRNMYAYFLAEKWKGVSVRYEMKNDFSKIFITFQDKGTAHISVNPPRHHLVKDNEVDDYLQLGNFKRVQLKFDECYCQTTFVANYILTHFPFAKDIKEKNPYKHRYENNQDLFVHYRIGDLEELQFMNPLEYYERAIEGTTFEHGYISSDSPTHENVKHLCQKYNLTLITKNQYDTILFGSTCKSIILSLGTYSWIIGLLAFHSEEVFHINPKDVTYWHGPIFEAFQQYNPNKFKIIH